MGARQSQHCSMNEDTSNNGSAFEQMMDEKQVVRSCGLSGTRMEAATRKGSVPREVVMHSQLRQDRLRNKRSQIAGKVASMSVCGDGSVGGGDSCSRAK